MKTETIPILIGVTGHRTVREADRPVLLDAVKRELEALKARCPHTRLVMLNALASGADQLCAEAAEALGIPLIAVLPFEKEAYEADFDGAALTAFRASYDRAEQAFVAPATEAEPQEPSRNFAYRQAGVYIAAHAQVLLALWDGEPGGECGTAAVVDCFLHGAYRPVYGAPLINAGVVVHVQTPRGDSTKTAGEVRLLGDREAWEELQKRTEEFNALAASCPKTVSPLLPAEREPDEALDRAEALYAAADALSVRYAALYRRILALIAVVSTVITLTFLVYDEGELHWMILLYGVSFLIAWGILRYARKSACHERYINCRALAEGLRVQAFLRYAGCRAEAGALLPWSQQEGSPWVASTIRASSVGGAPKARNEIRICWVEAQRDYHAAAAKKAEKKQTHSERIVRIAWIVSFVLYFIALIVELLSGTFFSMRPLITHANEIRTAMKFVWGGIAAATLFIGSYYGRLSLSRAVEDHRKMAKFYARLDDRLRRYGQTEETLVLLAREELIENSNWRSYQQDNAPELNI